MAKENTQYIELEKLIVTRAQGVFLWVFLIVEELLEGITNRDRIQTLILLVDSLPTTLEGYFERIIYNIDKRYRTSAARVLQISSDAPERLKLLTYDYFDEEETERTDTSHVHAIERYPEDLRRRLNARTKGLLEIVETAYGPEDAMALPHRMQIFSIK